VWIFLIVLGGLLGGYVASVARQPADLLVVQATTAEFGPVREIALWTLRRHDSCRDEDFLPASPIGFLIAGWDDGENGSRSAQLLEAMIDLGCNVNAVGASGLTPLHSAILFNNLPATTLLLHHGADPQLTTTIDKGEAKITIGLDARAFAIYLDEASGEDRSTIVQLLDEANNNI
jgi:hypothetical protein